MKDSSKLLAWTSRRNRLARALPFLWLPILGVMFGTLSVSQAGAQPIPSEAASAILSVTEALIAGSQGPINPDVPQFDIQVSAKLAEDRVEEGKPFNYSITLRWEGKQEWLNVESPKIEFPESFTLEDSPIRSRSMAGESGPVGVKEFVYTLLPAKAGTFKIPSVTLNILTPQSEKPSILETAAVEVKVEPRTVPASEKFSAFLSENGLIVGGGLVLIFAGVGVFLLQRRRNQASDTPEADPWEQIDQDWQRVEALRSSGNDREYYLAVESVLKKALGVFSGRETGNLEKAGEWDEISDENLKQDIRTLSLEIAERKYRPDRPRPEELDRSLRQAKRVLGTLKTALKKPSESN